MNATRSWDVKIAVGISNNEESKKAKAEKIQPIPPKKQTHAHVF
jgi:hypothetical protein